MMIFTTSTSTSSTLVTLLLVNLLISQVYAQEEQQQQQPPKINPADIASAVSQQVRGFLPMVNVDNQNNKSRVDVNVPLFFNMFKDNDKITGQSRLDLSVLSGLVTVNRGKERKPDGSTGGPLSVTVFGIPVYQGTANRKLPSENIESSVKGKRRSLNDILNDNSSNLQSSVVGQFSESIRRTNEKALRSIADTFNRMASTYSGKGSSISDGSSPTSSKTISDLTSGNKALQEGAATASANN